MTKDFEDENVILVYTTNSDNEVAVIYVVDYEPGNVTFKFDDSVTIEGVDKFTSPAITTPADGKVFVNQWVGDTAEVTVSFSTDSNGVLDFDNETTGKSYSIVLKAENGDTVIVPTADIICTDGNNVTIDVTIDLNDGDEYVIVGYQENA